jgi:hypothetical protein
MIHTHLRRVSPFESRHLEKGTLVQLGMRFDDHRVISSFVEEICRIVPGLRIAARDGELWRLAGPIPISKIPGDIDGLSEACSWIARRGFPEDGRVCNIGVGKTSLVINASHMAADGGFFAQILRHLQGRHRLRNSVESLQACDISLADEILNSDSRAWDINELTTISSPIRHRPTVRGTFAEFIRFNLPTAEMACFDPKTGKANRLTESIWSSFMLASHAFNGKVSGFCCPTCYDLRKNQDYFDFESSCLFTIVAPKAVCAPNETLEQMGVKMRRSLQDLMGSNTRLSFLRGISQPAIPNGCCLEMSHLGAIRLKRPIIDIAIQIQIPDWATNRLSLLTYAKLTGSFQNHFHASLRYPPSKLSGEEAQCIARLIEFGLRNLSPKMTIAEAFRMLCAEKSMISMSGSRHCK